MIFLLLYFLEEKVKKEDIKRVKIMYSDVVVLSKMEYFIMLIMKMLLLFLI